MGSTALFWFTLTLLCICVQSFYSMLEMACVSFNRVRLQYYAAQGHRRARWLHHLLSEPARLFGTTLLMVNLALQVGSECSRQFYEAAQIPPDLAPITQVILVLIFAELAPMFAARRYAESVSMLGVPVIYATSKILIPVTALIKMLSKAVNYLVGGSSNSGASSLSREEVQTILELAGDSGDNSGEGRRDIFDLVVTNIFALRHKAAKHILEPLSIQKMIPSTSTVGHMRQILRGAYYPYLLIFHQNPRNIVSIIYPRDLLKVPDEAEVQEHSHAPWFISQEMEVVDILHQFRSNNRKVAIVLNQSGQAVGILTLEDILDEIFGDLNTWHLQKHSQAPQSSKFVERSFAGSILMADFALELGVAIEHLEDETLSQYMTRVLEHLPESGETLRVEDLELRIESTSMLGAKAVSVKSL